MIRPKPDQNAILVGLSGVSSSGKTTLARILCDIFPNALILHQDDFFKTDSLIPVENGVQNWDCFEAIDLPAFLSAVKYARQYGEMPLNFRSIQDQDSADSMSIDPKILEEMKSRASNTSPIIVFVDGFLLYAEQMAELRALLDVKLFIGSDYTTVKTRRESRGGYKTAEGFWEDPPGIMENMVWPNYVKYHKHMFEGEDVQGEPDQEKIAKLNIHFAPKEIQTDMTACVQWACDVLEEALRVHSSNV
ncbi:Hypothetical protein R9X50_00099500 [Acrodontium crateriforme]|uniref:P-loop containing nucleoside triphosphate hydrolase protein n=1 Tax=Acrodontium crateriforme TaxID=150365 RepID=A0AAQ3LYK2_9PEZI|nr:Hypothetical protein R9X50_00099500 [Acrodontium crateriforme]